MEFRILGPLEVLEDGLEVEVGGAKHRALLAILLLHANETVSTNRLIEALWDIEAPANARKTLQVYVSQLRKALGRERVVTRSPGYRIDIGRDEFDVTRAEDFLKERKPEAALSLWRGPALSEFAYERFAQAEIARLEELRVTCLEERIDADLAAGRHTQLVSELEALVLEYPLRERLRAQRMLALYRSGRQAEALDAYQETRRVLMEGMGIEPGRALRELQQAILQQDAALDIDLSGCEVDERLPNTAHAAPEPGPRMERKTVTVVHTQLTIASEHGGRLDPEVLRHVTARVFGEITQAVEAHEGAVETITGDAVTAVFGLPLVHEDDAVRAVRAAEEIQSRLALVDWAGSDRRADLEIRIGVSTGFVVTGGESFGFQIRATGEPFGTSARLAQEGGAGEVVLDEATRRSVQTSRRDGRFASPMVGRERERRRLHDAFEQAAGDRSCQLFTILGAAGVGKSRLVQEFLADLSPRALVARGRCLPYGEGITFWPVLEAIKDVAGLDETVDPDAVRSRLATLVENEQDASLVVQRVTEVIGLAEAGAGADEGFRAVRTFVEALATNEPLVVVFDDVHWGEATFLDLVEHLADWSRGAPILLLCVARPDLLDVRPGWGGGKLNATSLLLEPLSHEECTELVSNLVGETELAEEVESRIAEAAEGNPLYVEEVLSMLIEEGLLVREGDRWTAAGDLSAFPVPPTIQALLAARLDQLSVAERAAIEPAAIEGKVFHESAIIRLSPNGATVSDALDALVRKELIRPARPVFAGERAFRFRHLMIRDAAYDAIPKEVRAAWHEQHVEWLEQRTGGRSVEFDEIVGYHLEQAVHYRTELGETMHDSRELGRHAAERFGTAGRRAFMRSDAPAGVNLISRAVALLAPDDPLRVELVPNVRVVQGIPDLSWADRVLTEAVEAAATTGDRRLAAHALVQRSLLRLFTDPHVTPQELIDGAHRAIDVFEELSDELGLARAWRLVAQAHYLGRRMGSCAEASERALEHARRIEDRFEEREIVEWLVIAHLLGPTPAADAIARFRLLLDETSPHPPLQASILAGLAHLVAMQGRLDEAVEVMERSKATMEETGEWIWLVSFWWGYAYVWQGDPVGAERELRPAYEALKRIGETSHFSSIAHELAQVVYAQGRYDEAEGLTRECEDACRANDVHSHIMWRSIRGMVFAQQGALEDAEALAREAIEFAEASDFLPAHADALSGLAEVLTLAGRREEAARALQGAIDLYERKGNVLATAASRRRLATA